MMTLRPITSSQNPPVFSGTVRQPIQAQSDDQVTFAGKPSSLQFSKEKPLKGRVLSATELTPNPDTEVRDIVIDVSGKGLEVRAGQSIAVLPPTKDGDSGNTWPRFYSVAGIERDAHGKAKTLTLCVKRNIKRDEHGQEIKRGLGSNFLCDMKAGDPVELFGPFGELLIAPPKPDANIILIATGTGVASFRALLKERYGEGSGRTGETRLLFGVPGKDDLFYQDEFAAYEKDPGFRFISALSRDDGKRVTDRIGEHGADLFALLKQPHTYVYICGINKLEEDVPAAFKKYADAHGEDWERLFGALKAEGRWRMETKPVFKQYLIQAGLEEYTRAPEAEAPENSFKRLIKRLFGWLFRR